MVEFRQKFNEQLAGSALKQQTKKVLPFILILSGILIILGGFAMGFGEDSEDFYTGLYVIVLGIILPLIFFVVLKIAQRSYNKSMSLLGDNTEQIFAFDAQEVIITQTKGDEYESRTKAKYSFLWRVEETHTHYFLYIAKGQCHVLSKSCITQGSIDELNSYLMSNLVYKYKQKY